MVVMMKETYIHVYNILAMLIVKNSLYDYYKITDMARHMKWSQGILLYLSLTVTS